MSLPDTVCIELEDHPIVASLLTYRIGHVNVQSKSAMVLWNLTTASGESVRSGVYTVPAADFASFTQDGVLPAALLAATATQLRATPLSS